MVRSGVKHMILQCDYAVVLEGVSLFQCVCMWWEGGGYTLEKMPPFMLSQSPQQLLSVSLPLINIIQALMIRTRTLWHWADKSSSNPSLVTTLHECKWSKKHQTSWQLHLESGHKLPTHYQSFFFHWVDVCHLWCARLYAGVCMCANCLSLNIFQSCQGTTLFQSFKQAKAVWLAKCLSSEVEELITASCNMRFELPRARGRTCSPFTVSNRLL